RTCSLNTVYGTVSASSGDGKNSHTIRKFASRISRSHGHDLRGGIVALSSPRRGPRSSRPGRRWRPGWSIRRLNAIGSVVRRRPIESKKHTGHGGWVTRGSVVERG